MFSADSEFAEFAKNGQNNNFNKYLNYVVVSKSNKTNALKELSKANHVIRAITEESSSASYNSTAVGHIQHDFKLRGSKRNDYYLFYKFNDSIQEVKSFPIDPIEHLKMFNYDVKRLNDALKSDGIGVELITGSSTTRWAYNRMAKDNKISEMKKDDKKYLVIAQNKVTDQLLNELSNSDKSVGLIHDEITFDSIDHITQDDISLLKETLTEISKRKNRFVTPGNKIVLERFGIYDKVKAADTDLYIRNLVKNMTAVAYDNHVEFSFNNIGVNGRLKSVNNTMVLTSEKFSAGCLSYFFDYKTYELNKGFKFEDQNYNIYKSEFITKANKEFVCELTDSYKLQENKKTDTLTIGTSYFNTDMTIDAVKGRNYGSIKRMGVFKNPDPYQKAFKYIHLFKENEHKGITVDENVKNYIKILFATDQLDQIIGRISGYRRERNPDTEIDLFYYKDDGIMDYALTMSRYKGKVQTNSSDKITKLLKERNELLEEVKTAEPFFNVYNNKNIFDKKYNITESNFNFTFGSIVDSSDMTIKGILRFYIPELSARLIGELDKYGRAVTYMMGDVTLKNYDKFSKAKKNSALLKQIADEVISRRNSYKLEENVCYNRTLDLLSKIKLGDYSELDLYELASEKERNKYPVDIQTFIAYNLFNIHYHKYNHKNFCFNDLRADKNYMYANMHSIKNMESMANIQYNKIRTKGRGLPIESAKLDIPILSDRFYNTGRGSRLSKVAATAQIVYYMNYAPERYLKILFDIIRTFSDEETKMISRAILGENLMTEALLEKIVERVTNLYKFTSYDTIGSIKEFEKVTFEERFDLSQFIKDRDGVKYIELSYTPPDQTKVEMEKDHKQTKTYLMFNPIALYEEAYKTKNEKLLPIDEVDDSEPNAPVMVNGYFLKEWTTMRIQENGSSTKKNIHKQLKRMSILAKRTANVYSDVTRLLQRQKNTNASISLVYNLTNETKDLRNKSLYNKKLDRNKILEDYFFCEKIIAV